MQLLIKRLLMVLVAVFSSVLVLLIMAFSVFDIQYKLLYYPNSSLPSRESLIADDLQFWPSETRDYRAFVSDSDQGKYKGTVVIFHGNAGTAADRSYYVKALRPLGYRVLLAEYPGYGARNGELGELSFVNDARATVKLVFKQYGIPIYLLGESLGCGVVAAIVKDVPVPIDGIVLITPWDTLLSIAKEKFPLFPVRLLLKDTYDSIGNLKGFQGRIAIIAAERDEIIPMRHADELYGSLSGSKRKWVIGGAGHNDWPMSVDRQWWHNVMGFVSEKGK
jgi:pimeloyl-ACP methyl ester carboxylesterase